MRTFLLIISILLFTSCKPQSDKVSLLKVDNLRKTSIFKKTKVGNKLIISLKDNSWNGFKDYKELKSKVFVYDNFEIIKKYDSVVISFSLKTDKLITFKYDKNEIRNISKKISSNIFLKRNLYVLSKSMNFNEYWNIRGMTKQFSEIENDNEKIDFLKLITNHSKYQKLKLKNEFETKRLTLLRNFFKERGMQDGWQENKNTVNARNLVKQIDTILSFELDYKKKEKDLLEQSLYLTQSFKDGNIYNIKNEFYSYKKFEKISNIKQIISDYQEQIKTLEIDKKENIIKKRKQEFIKNKKIDIFYTYVPLGVKMPSVVPEYYLEYKFIEKNNDSVLIGFNLLNTKTNKIMNEIKKENRIKIDKDSIINFSFMYEGGFKKPLIFKNKTNTISKLDNQKSEFELLLKLLNNSKVIKVKKENETKRFNGDPEIEIITLKLKNNFNWTMFSIISQEPNKPNKLDGTLELRYYKHLNIAVTYWIESEDNDLLLRIFHNLCNSGKNIRTEPKKSIQLELEYK